MMRATTAPINKMAFKIQKVIDLASLVLVRKMVIFEFIFFSIKAN